MKLVIFMNVQIKSQNCNTAQLLYLNDYVNVSEKITRNDITLLQHMLEADVNNN